MVPNPIIIPRKELAERGRSGREIETGRTTTPAGQLGAIVSTSIVVLLVATQAWARRWLYSGSAIESLLIIYGSASGTRIFSFMPLWTVLASLNLAYAVASTSWLLYGCFAAVCYPTVLLTFLIISSSALQFMRRSMRGLLNQLHFIGDKVAFFNLPALEIDADVDGLLVVRGLTISLSTLTIEAHGVELGLKLAEDIELALYVDTVSIHLFRRIEISEVYSALKGGKIEGSFGDHKDRKEDEGSLYETLMPPLNPTSLNSNGLKPPRPSVAREMTGGVNVKDTSARMGIGAVTSMSVDESGAEKQYQDIRQHILDTSPIHESRERVEIMLGDKAFQITEKETRAAMCAQMQQIQSVPHPPTRSIRVTTLQNLPPPWLRRFLHRLPFLLRLLLMPLSYLHPIAIASMSVAGSGRWLKTILDQNIFEDYAEKDSKIKSLNERIGHWLEDAKFCLDVTDIDALGQVPLRTVNDIVSYIRCANIMLFRTALDSRSIESVIQLGGCDVTVVVPSYLLPHHEHLLPAEPTDQAEREQVDAIDEADGPPKEVQAEHDLEKLQKDEAEVLVSVHGKFPAYMDQSLLNFIAALVKATKMIEMEKEGDKDNDDDYDDEGNVPRSTDSPTEPSSPTDDSESGIKRRGSKLVDKVKDVRLNFKGGVKKAVVSGMVNDRWIAQLVGRFAAKLERLQGDIGYSGGIPVALEVYRTAGLPSKLLT